MRSSKAKTEQVYAILKNLPAGTVTTYGAIAKRLRIHPRAVAAFLKKNKHPDKIPCYKVVMSDRKIGGYTLGVKEKLRRLRADGIKIKNKNEKIDELFIYRF